jgi:positive regulator of sigma E activity
MNPQPPRCPACGSSATLPFESEEDSAGDESFVEIMLTVLIFFLALFLAFLLFLLSRASLPVALILLLAAFLFWRRKKEKLRRARAKSRRRTYVCLDCSQNFDA